ncbi:ABC transporter G family member 10-like [Punica granatum]|nr:ABC transporter G family member 10-like [Punica granatum]OWM73352.1 hypothetical protein CDL15_Pgr001466 [Punica granatum]
MEKTRYTIRTKKISYKLSPQSHRFGPFRWRKPTAAAETSADYILRNVDCEARPGEITAIAGPSGAGKTTLLEILAGVISTRRVSGRVLINNQPMNKAHFRRVSGYVTQDEALFPYLTVEETLMYSAWLRLGGGTDGARARVRELLRELGLERVADVRVGSETSRGISGGERRRVSIGVDIVHEPAVLLLDEPTSGLDSASALDVALLLKSMASKLRRTIVLTIHQPGFRILELFDQILLLSSGTVLHHGPLDLLEQRLIFSGHSIPRHVNVLEFAIEVAQSFTDYTMQNEMDEIDLEVSNYELFSRISGESKMSYPNSRIKEVLILGKRFSSNICRTKQLFIARTVQSLLAGVVLGTIFLNASDNPSRVNVQTQLGFFAFSLTFLLSSTTEGLPIYLQERRILMRETRRGAYRVSSYVISNALVFLPFLLVIALLYAMPVYWLVGLRRDTAAFIYFTLVIWMVLLASNSFVACFSALVPNYIMGMSLIAGLTGSFFLFSGYFISEQDMPRYWVFMHYLSLFKYPFECFVANEYGGSRGRCVASVEGQCLLSGDAFLKQQGLKESQKLTNLGVMLGFIVGYRFLCFLILCYRSCRTRG